MYEKGERNKQEVYPLIYKTRIFTDLNMHTKFNEFIEKLARIYQVPIENFRNMFNTGSKEFRLLCEKHGKDLPKILNEIPDYTMLEIKVVLEDFCGLNNRNYN